MLVGCGYMLYGFPDDYSDMPCWNPMTITWRATAR
jgi:hypothetical protein